MIDKVISPYQTAFIPGRNILEGVVILQEVMHEVRSSMSSGVFIKLDFEKTFGKVKWEFLEEVLYMKGFAEKWIQWLNKADRGGRVCIDLNGDRGEFFRSYKGLGQGDPLSPLLFNLVVNAPSGMLSRVCATGIINGLVPNLVEGGLSHLHYADDTVILLQYSPEILRNIRLILSSYEVMSGMKINYEKSEIFSIGINEELLLAANVFGCKIGSFLMKYLGMPVSSSKISKAQLGYVSDKIEKRLGMWQCEYLSSGGRSSLIDSCLSSVPLYTMGVYQLYEGNFQKIDAIRARFY